MNLDLIFDEGVQTPSSSYPPKFNASEDFNLFSKEVKSYAKKIIKDAIRFRGFNEALIDKIFLGKMTRSRLVYSLGQSLQVSYKRIIGVAATIELLHEASLVHDDIQDQQKHRRDIPTVWYEYSMSEAISWGDFLLSLSFTPLLNLEDSNKDDLKVLNLTIQNMLEGQNIEQTSIGRFIDRKTYFKIAKLKTGALIELPVRLLITSKNPNFENLLIACKSFAIAYQAKNDLKDFLQGRRAIDYINKIPSLPFIELYELRLKNNLLYDFSHIYCEEAQKSETYLVSQAINKVVDENLDCFNAVFSSTIEEKHFKLLKKSINQYFCG